MNLNLHNALVLVSCVSEKSPTPLPAKKFYRSQWFSKVREIVELECAEWYILSGKYGLVDPDQIIEPYDQTLNDMRLAERREWAGKVMSQLEPKLQRRRRIVFFAGDRYREFLVPALESDKHQVEVPMQGLAIGKQLQWLSIHARPKGLIHG